MTVLVTVIVTMTTKTTGQSSVKRKQTGLEYHVSEKYWYDNDINLNKIVTFIVFPANTSYAKTIIGKYQAGFKKKRSTIDHIFTVKLILKKFWEGSMGLLFIS
ncbi:hypothetical protein ANN_10252 [Periplaneta americana]|uniref:Uncharacterized protein n=1 Tax=Periplaneta americana TaxID=6978 RepID=A0ABQ8TPK8_PERAM|nr:hypothetical protein ANN_10252 [Periplaneta americana]